MSTTAVKETGAVDISKEMLISSDSHIMEPADLWERQMPASQRDQVPKFSTDGGDNKPGGYDGKERVKEMAADGVSPLCRP